ncbi:MAG: TetR/AcrR family transcriptional regulator [Anaerovoracaceae bacterium]
MDLRIERTYMLLHNAFTQLLEKKRFEDFTVNELCQCAMIRRTTFYKHFADKYEYFTFYMKEICSTFQSKIPGGADLTDLNGYFLSMSRELLHFISLHEKMVSNVASSTMFPVLLDILSDNITEDVIRVLRQMNSTKSMSNGQMEGIASFYSGGLLNMLRLRIKSGSTIVEEDFINALSNILGQRSRQPESNP